MYRARATGHTCATKIDGRLLQPAIEQLFDNPPEHYPAEHFALFGAFKLALNAGTIRAAEPDATQPSGWCVNTG